MSGGESTGGRKSMEEMRKIEEIKEADIPVPTACRLCPRGCGRDRTREIGYCGGGSRVRLARAMAHQWEEPCFSGAGGAGALFFSGCPLGCAFCQNRKISVENFGAEISAARLAEIFLELQEKGVSCIELISAQQYLPWVAAVLRKVRPLLSVPVVYNSGGYERTEALKMLEGLIDVYLPDLKYISAELSRQCAGAEDYFTFAAPAIEEMFRQTGPFELDGRGVLRRGVLVRHLVLPGFWRDSLDVIDWLAGRFSSRDILLSVMRQYTPPEDGTVFPEPLKSLRRRLSTFEYRKVMEKVEKAGFEGYFQEAGAAESRYTPDFSLQGVFVDKACTEDRKKENDGK